MTDLVPFGPRGNFFECPRWHGGRWWLSDFFAEQIVVLAPDGGTDRVIEVGTQPGGLGWLPDGSLVAVAMVQQRLLRFDEGSGRFVEYVDLSGLFSGNANDMVIGPDGVAYVSNFGFDFTVPPAATPATCLVSVTPDGVAQVAAEGLRFPNSCVLTADHSTLIVNETYGARHTAFTVSGPGQLTDQRVWAQPFGAPADPDHAAADLSYAPDGSCVDARGRLWSADALSDRVVQLAEGGEVHGEVRVPSGLHPFACALGGTDRRTLLVTAAPAPGRVARAASRDSVLFVGEVDDPGPPL